MKKAFVYAALNFLVAAAIWILPELVFSLISGGSLAAGFTRPGFLVGFGACALLASVFTFFSVKRKAAC